MPSPISEIVAALSFGPEVAEAAGPTLDQINRNIGNSETASLRLANLGTTCCKKARDFVESRVAPLTHEILVNGQVSFFTFTFQRPYFSVRPELNGAISDALCSS